MDRAKRHIVFSKYHPSRPCGPCALCGKSEGYYSHFGGWEEGEKSFVAKHLGQELSPDSCVCRGDQKEAKRHKNNPGYIPKWSSPITTPSTSTCSQCFFPGCTVTEKLISPSFDSASNIEAVLCRQPLPSEPILLCTKHYRNVHRKLASPPACKSCGTQPKPGTWFTRHSPDAHTICSHLQNTVGMDIVLQPSDKICAMCYKAHIAILKSLEEQLNTPDNILKESMDIWEMVKRDDNTNHLTKTVLTIVLFVAKELLLQRALLLPAVCRMFLAEYGGCDSQSELHLESREGMVSFSSRWLLQQIIMYLGPHLCYKCVHRKFGTILYRKGGDLLHALSWALASQAKESEVFLKPSLDQHRNGYEENSIKEAGDIINNLLHDHIKQSTSKEYDPTTLHINNLIQEVNPLLWLFLDLATRSVRERARPHRVPHSEAMHTKNVRRYYILCLMLNCTNPTQTTPIHLVLTDTVEVCGGSRKLMKILNRVGAVCSADTHDRFVTSIAEHQRDKSVWDDLSSNVFTVASADNFDLLQVMLESIVVISTVATMEQQFSLFNQTQICILIVR